MIEIRTYDIPLAELIIIARCMQDHPDLNGKKLASLMGISKSNFYRKVKLLADPDIQTKLIDLGYTLSFVQKMQTIQSIS